MLATMVRSYLTTTIFHQAVDMPKTKIKRLSLDDLEALVRVSRQTFSETFAEHNSEDNMRLYLSRHLNEGNLKAELEDESTEFYFALVDDAVAGYLKIKYNSNVEGLDESTNVEIERIYLLKEFQQK